MTNIVVSMQGDNELIAKLKKFGVAVLDLSRGMDETGQYLTGFFSGEVFASEVEGGGQAGACRGRLP